MPRHVTSIVLGLAGCWINAAAAQDGAWTFAVAGDSRDCGNIVMPAIAAGARRDAAQFYWHLGDFRAIFRVDQDYAAERRFATYRYRPGIADYLNTAWADFAQHQLAPFGEMPVFLGIGNHEVIPPKTPTQYRIEFGPWLDRAELREQRRLDAASGLPAIAHDQTYNHWHWKGVDFINLDNAVDDAFDDPQLAWLDKVLDADLADPSIRAVVVGMHDPLPYSLAEGHDMADTPAGLKSGLRVYRRLLEIQHAKPVFVVTTHAHYYLANIFDTPHWRAESRDSVLPGWIVGTAGAERYPLPEGVQNSENARGHAYGYLLGEVAADGQIRFVFHELDEAALQAARTDDYAPETVAACFSGNPVLSPR